MSIQGLSCNAKFLAQIADLGFWLSHRRHSQPQLGRRHLERSAALPAACPRRRQARHRALCDQLALELGECGEDAEDQLASGGRGVDGRPVTSQHLEADAAPGQIVHGIDEMPQVAPKPVERKRPANPS